MQAPICCLIWWYPPFPGLIRQFTGTLCLHINDEGRWPAGRGIGGVPLFCPMLIWLYYNSIDFLPCTQAIDAEIYHANCRSMPGQEFIHRSMWHREEDKETIQSPCLLEEDGCFPFQCPFFFKENLLKTKWQIYSMSSFFISIMFILGSNDLWGFRCITKVNRAHFIQCNSVFSSTLAALLRQMVRLLSLFVSLSLYHPSLAFSVCWWGQVALTAAKLKHTFYSPFLFRLNLLWHAKVLMVLKLGHDPNGKHLIERNEGESSVHLNRGRRNTKGRPHLPFLLFSFSPLQPLAHQGM